MKKCLDCNKKLVAKNWCNSLQKQHFYICNQCHYKRYHTKWAQSLLGVFYRYKSEAKRRNRIFKLSQNELWALVTQPCFYCGNIEKNFNGVDRIDNNIGYVLNNCVPCCSICNFMKHTQPQNQFIHKCFEIYKKQEELNNGIPFLLL